MSIIIFIKRDVLKNPLNGVTINKTIKNIDTAEHIHTFFVVSVKTVKLNAWFGESIFIIDIIFILLHSNIF
jgi:hypothetical protein